KARLNRLHHPVVKPSELVMERLFRAGGYMIAVPFKPAPGAEQPEVELRHAVVGDVIEGGFEDPEGNSVFVVCSHGCAVDGYCEIGFYSHLPAVILRSPYAQRPSDYGYTPVCLHLRKYQRFVG